jgi:NADH dehydrogenase
MPRIVIVGGGAGGLELATWLGKRRRRLGVEVVLVDATLAHLWKPRLHEVAVGLMNDGEDATSYLGQGLVSGFAFEWGPITGLDSVRKIIRLGPVAGHRADHKGEHADTPILPEREIGYDILVLAIGSRVNDFGIEGVAQYCFMLDQPSDARRLHQALLDASFKSEPGPDQALKVGIVGAGATGVELSAELDHAVHSVETYGRLAEGRRLEITLIEHAERVLPSTQPETSRFAQAALEKAGVTVRCGQKVQKVDRDCFELASGERIRSDIKVWTSGIVGHDVVTHLAGLTIEKGKRIATDRYLACIGVSDIYALGDCSAVPAETAGMFLPATAQVAHQQAIYLLRALTRKLKGQSIKPFSFESRGTLVSLGVGAAGEIPKPRRDEAPFRTSGRIAKLMYIALYFMHRVALHGWWKAGLLALSDRVRGIASPPVKLH